MEKYARIVTHTDFDGLVSALLIRELFDIEQVTFAEPWMLQKREFPVRRGDVILDLPYGEGCALWFDHHATSLPDKEKGFLDEHAKSCARVIFEHYIKEHPKLERFRELVDAADKIDSAAFTSNDLEHPDVYGKISMAIRGDDRRKDDEFRLFLLNLLSFQSPEQAIAQPIIRKRVEEKLRQHEEWLRRIGEYVQLRGEVIYVDRTLAPEDLPRGQQFFLYLMYPGHGVYLSCDRVKFEPDLVRFSCGENIFEQRNAVEIGALMQRFGGGGHKSAGGCSVPKAKKEETANVLIAALNGGA